MTLPLTLAESIQALQQTPGTCPEASHLIEAARQVNAGETTLAQVIAEQLSPECGLPHLAGNAPAATLQQRVHPWLLKCFGAEIAADKEERNHRFLEEAIELVQACGCTRSEAHQLVDYVFGRPTGDPHQEAGGVMITLAALCLANGLDMDIAGEDELARIWKMVEKIRAKQAAKPKHSPLPEMPKDATPEAALYTRWRETTHNTFESNGRRWRIHNTGGSNNPPCDGLTEVAVLNRDQKIETGTARSFTWGWTAQSLEIIGWYPLSMEERLAERDAAIADLNQRLIDRTTGTQATIASQQLELNRLRTELRQEKEILEAFTYTFDATPSPEDSPHYVPVHILALVTRQRDEATAKHDALLKAAQDREAEHIIDKILLEERSTHPVVTLEHHESELRAQENVTQTYRAGVLSALEAANAPTHHPKTDAPHPKPMMPCERILALAAQRDEFGADALRLNAALQQAYVHNQNMHCLQTKGRLNDELNHQTVILREALKPVPTGSADLQSAPVQPSSNEAPASTHPDEDPFQSEDYQRFVAETAKTCAAEDSPCDSCLAGGICDGPTTALDYHDPQHDEDDTEDQP